MLLKPPKFAPLQSIYEQICCAIKDDGTLPSSFILHTLQNREITFVPGMLDSMYVLHKKKLQDYDIEPLCEAVLVASSGEFAKAEDLLNKFFDDDNKARFVPYFWEFRSRIYDTHQDEDAGILCDFGMNLVKCSSRVEVVKVGIAILSAIQGRNEPTIDFILRKMALCNEFTLLCFMTFGNRKNGNELIFEIGKKVYGWGRIYAVLYLEPKTEEIKEWLLTQGYKNCLGNFQSVLLCAEKSGLFKLLEASEIGQGYFRSASELIGCLAARWSGEVVEIDGADALFEHYLYHALKHELTLEDYQTIILIVDLLRKQPIPAYKKHSLMCKVLLYSPHCKKTIEEAIKRGTGFALAKRMGFPCNKEIYSALYSNLEKNYCLMNYLFADGEYVNEMVLLFERKLPLKKIARGPADERRFGQKFRLDEILNLALKNLVNYPGKGANLVACGLLSSVSVCRNTALDVLQAWQDNYVPYTKKIERGLKKLKSHELNKSIQRRLAAL